MVLIPLSQNFLSRIITVAKPKKAAQSKKYQAADLALYHDTIQLIPSLFSA
jgi:hypothetical protein